ncbi:MAG TPA: MiaB/RimO family radical SAM methylthiotransferase [bacterium]|nr:MiaB/RimO family radical SAM methylthiotransferase [bacterium]
MASPSGKRRVAIVTFGCKVNLFESEQLVAALSGYTVVEPEAVADIYIVNGCTVTAAADAQVRSMARRLARSGGEVIVTGCYARTADAHRPVETGIRYLPDIAAVAQHLERAVSDEFTVFRARPVIKIEDGCNGSCAYCIIPSVRGRDIRSVPPDTLEKLLHSVHDRGYREVVLTGIHVGKYGHERADGARLADIVEMAHAIVGRVRLSSLEADEIDDQLLALAAAGKIVPHWHIPLQAGSDAVLRAMRRPYDTRLFAEKVRAVEVAYAEPPAIGTDVIVGFPGESDADFEAAFAFISSLPFTYGHVFPFSPRPGTPAAEMHKKFGVPPAVKKEQARRLRELFAEKKRLFQRSQTGRTMGMILETEIASDRFEGTTDTYFQLTYRGKGAIKELKRVVIRKEGKGYFAEEA